jgi:ADP-heptose:LPS heptosyltransferase
MGDVAMTIPVLRAMELKYPEVKITVVSRPFFKPLFNDLSNVSFFAADVNGRHKGFMGILKLFSDLKKLQIDAVADVHNVLRSKILSVLFTFNGKKCVKIDKGRTEKKALTRTKNKVFKQLKTTHERYADVFRKLGFEIDLNKDVLLEKKVLPNYISNKIGVKNEQWIGIAPFAQYESKMYPLDLMEKVIQEIAQQNVKIFLFGGGKKEAEKLQNLALTFNNVYAVAGLFSFDDELKLISQLDCMVSMDSGNAHLAALFGVPTITLWGATHPYTGFAPFLQPFDNNILPNLQQYPNLPCSIYGNKVCDGYENVMRSIAAEKIIKKIAEML